jgi:hypothetical protein
MSAPIARRRRGLVARVALITAGGLTGGGVLGLAALRAAGLNGTAPAGAAEFKQLISTLTSNWEWLIATGIGLAFMIVAGMVIFGSQRGIDHVFRIGAGIMLILVVIPAVLA